MNNTLKETIKYCDILSFSIVATVLKKHYYFVSVANNSVPKEGSTTFKAAQLKEGQQVTILRAIKHRNGNVTLITKEAGYLKFWN